MPCASAARGVHVHVAEVAEAARAAAVQRAERGEEAVALGRRRASGRSCGCGRSRLASRARRGCRSPRASITASPSATLGRPKSPATKKRTGAPLDGQGERQRRRAEMRACRREPETAACPGASQRDRYARGSGRIVAAAPRPAPEPRSRTLGPSRPRRESELHIHRWPALLIGPPHSAGASPFVRGYTRARSPPHVELGCGQEYPRRQALPFVGKERRTSQRSRHRPPASMFPGLHGPLCCGRSPVGGLRRRRQTHPSSR